MYRSLTDWFKQKKENKVTYNEFINNNKDEKIVSFLPLLYLEDQKKIWLEQKEPFDEIHIWLKETFLKHNPDPFEDLKKELEEYDNNPENFKDEEINEEEEE